MASFDDVRKAAEHLRLRHETRRAPLAGFIVLLFASAASYAYRRADARWWTPALVLVLALGPWLLDKVLPPRHAGFLRLSLAAYPLNILLLAFIAYREFWRVDIPFLEDVPQLSNALDWTAPLIPFVYAYLQFPGWLARIRLLPRLKDLARLPPDPLVVKEVEELADKAVHDQPSGFANPARFRTLPATPANWRLFLKPDLRRHGIWKVAFSPTYAVVCFEDAGRLEAVKRGGLKIVAEDFRPGEATASCLVRWNDNLSEGRVDPDSLKRIQGWNQVQV